MKTIAQFLFVLVMYAIGVAFFGAALAPGIFLVIKTARLTASSPLGWRCLALGFSVSAGYFLFGFTLIFLAGSVRTLLRLKLKEGNYPLFSFGAMKWAFVSALYLLINFTFIDFILLTPFASLLLQMLGAKIGKNVQVNSKFVFDASLLEIGDDNFLHDHLRRFIFGVSPSRAQLDAGLAVAKRNQQQNAVVPRL